MTSCVFPPAPAGTPIFGSLSEERTRRAQIAAAQPTQPRDPVRPEGPGTPAILPIVFAPALFPVSYPDGASNLACDEALLDAAEAGECGAVLRFWESATPFVTLGYTNAAASEVKVENCVAAGVPVLRRCSGGGTVLQGPGCFNYALIAPFAPGEALNLEATNRLVMECNRAAFEAMLGQPVCVSGYTDLAVGQRKFSGNAQRRKRRFFLFHGTALLHFDVSQIENFLQAPSREPDYRQGREHGAFVQNVPLTPQQFRDGLALAWGATTEAVPNVESRIAELLTTRYSTQEWNERF